MKFNVILPCYKRQEYLNTCLFYLLEAVKVYEGTVDIFVATENLDEIKFKDRSCIHFYECPFEYSKSSYNNYLLSYIKDGNIVFMDCDMIYPSLLFDLLETNLKNYNYITMQGRKLSEESTKLIGCNLLGIEELKKLKSEVFNVSPSQLCITKEVYDIFLNFFKETFFNEFYKGWGCEDSEISFKGKFLFKKGIIKKGNILDMWFHLYHLSTYNEEEYKRNFIHFQEKRKLWK